MVNNPVLCKCEAKDKFPGFRPLTFRSSRTNNNGNTMYFVQCIRCNKTSPKCTSPFAAINAWNGMPK